MYSISHAAITSTFLDKCYKVTEFHELVGHPISKLPVEIYQSDFKRLIFRLELIYSELVEADESKDTVELLDAIVDTIYVICGFLVEYGLCETLVVYMNKKSLDSVSIVNICILEQCITILNVLYKLAKHYEIDDLIDEAFNKIHDNNMTKACTSKEEADRTCQQYKDKGIATYFVRRVLSSGKEYFVVYREDNKVLKPMSYKKVNLESLFTNKVNKPIK